MLQLNTRRDPSMRLSFPDVSLVIQAKFQEYLAMSDTFLIRSMAEGSDEMLPVVRVGFFHGRVRVVSPAGRLMAVLVGKARGSWAKRGRRTHSVGFHHGTRPFRAG